MVPLKLDFIFGDKAGDSPRACWVRRKGSTPLSHLFYIFEETHGFKKVLGCCKQLPAERSGHVGCIVFGSAYPLSIILHPNILLALESHPHRSVVPGELGWR